MNYCIDDVLDRFKKPKQKKEQSKKQKEEETSSDTVSVTELKGVQEAIDAVDELTSRMENGEEVSDKEVDVVVEKSNEVTKSIIRDNKKSHPQQQSNNQKDSMNRKEESQSKKVGKKKKEKESDDCLSIIIDFD